MGQKLKITGWVAIGVIAGALPFITDHFTLSNRLQEWVVSSMMLGAAIGALWQAVFGAMPGTPL